METVTTMAPSVWFYDNVYSLYHSGNIFVSDDPYHMILKYNADYYAISSPAAAFTENGLDLGYTYSSIKFDSVNMKWGTENSWSELPSSAFDENGFIPYDSINILAQNLDSKYGSYYTTEQFMTGNVYAPMGSIADSIYTTNVLDGVLGLLPSLLVVLVVFMAIRKGVSFLTNLLRGV